MDIWKPLLTEFSLSHNYRQSFYMSNLHFFRFFSNSQWRTLWRSETHSHLNFSLCQINNISSFYIDFLLFFYHFVSIFHNLRKMLNVLGIIAAWLWLSFAFLALVVIILMPYFTLDAHIQNTCITTLYALPSMLIYRIHVYPLCTPYPRCSYT